MHETVVLAIRAGQDEGVEERPDGLTAGMPRRRTNSGHVSVCFELAASAATHGLRADKHFECDMAVEAGFVSCMAVAVDEKRQWTNSRSRASHTVEKAP